MWLERECGDAREDVPRVRGARRAVGRETVRRAAAAGAETEAEATPRLSARALARSIERLHAGGGGSEGRRARVAAVAAAAARESSAVKMSATSRRLAARRRAKTAREDEPAPAAPTPTPDADDVLSPDCTFAPTISRRSREISSKMLGNSSASFVERSKSWAETKERVLEAEREARIEGSLRECTFRPQITAKTSEAASGGASTSRSTTTLTTSDASASAGETDSVVARAPPGLDSYLARQEAARRMREAKNAALNRFTGSTWTGARTTPKEFSFATDARLERRAAANVHDAQESTTPKSPAYVQARAKLYRRRTAETTPTPTV